MVDLEPLMDESISHEQRDRLMKLLMKYINVFANGKLKKSTSSVFIQTLPKFNRLCISIPTTLLESSRVWYSKLMEKSSIYESVLKIRQLIFQYWYPYWFFHFSVLISVLIFSFFSTDIRTEISWFCFPLWHSIYRFYCSQTRLLVQRSIPDTYIPIFGLIGGGML